MPNNVWKCEVVDRHGDRREYTCRGPETEWEMRRSLARGFLDPQRRRAWETGVPFPEGDPFPELVTHPEKYIVSVKPAGTDQTSTLGDWQPMSAKPYDINRYANRDPETGEPVFPAPPVPPKVAERGVDMTPRPVI
jgi:hypothetical protein